MLRTIEPAAAAPVSLDEARAHLRRDDYDDDAMIALYVAAATARAEAEVQRRFTRQTVEFVTRSWYGGRLDLPVAPVRSDDVVSITYIDQADAQQTLDPASYSVRARGPSVRIVPRAGATWPLVSSDAAEPIVIRFTAGDLPAAIAPNVKAAILLIVGHLYENRANVIVNQAVQAVELPQGARDLLLPELW